jgi:hypothetical protein
LPCHSPSRIKERQAVSAAFAVLDDHIPFQGDHLATDEQVGEERDALVLMLGIFANPSRIVKK